MKKIFCALLAVAMLLAIGCTGPAANTDPGGSTPAVNNTETPATSGEEKVYFAVVGPMTGDSAEYGIGFRQSAQIMVDNWNAKGGLLGKTIELKVYDDKGTPEEAANVAEQIVADGSIVAVIGHFASSCSMAAAPIYQDHGMLQISPTSSHADFTGIGDWIWRVSPLSSDESRTVAKTVLNHFNAKTVGILVLNNDWGRESGEMCEMYLEQFKGDREITIVKEFVVEGNDDYSSVVTNFVSAGVDTVVCSATYPVAAPFLVQMKAAMPEVNAIAHGNCQVQQVLDILGDQSEGFVCSAAWSHIFVDDASVDYVTKYKAMDANGINPIGDFAQYFDTCGVIFQAIENIGTFDREAIREELKTIEYDGLSGKIKFDEKRDCPRDYGTVVAKNGEWTQLVID